MPGFIGPLAALRNSAPLAGLQGAALTVLDHAVDGNVATWRVALDWPFEIHRALVAIGPQTALVEVSIDGPRAGPVPVGPSFAFAAPPSDGLVVHIRTSSDSPLEITSIAQIYALPEFEEFAYAQRPPDTMPAVVFNQGYESTYVQNTLTIAPPVPSQFRSQ
jgi:hypothetical protein